MSGAPGLGDAGLIDGPGTDEAVWADWSGLTNLPRLDTSGWTKAVAVAAHPDDEVLGVGGLLALLAAAGAELHLLAVTDGEGSHPRSARVAPGTLAARRVAETAAALRCLGIGDVHVVRMQLPDAGLAAYGPQIRDATTELLGGADACFAPWSSDAHVDHEVCGGAVRAAGEAAGVAVFEYPIWAWHWAAPEDPRVPWSTAKRVPLPPDVLARKRSALSCFESQIHPVGPDPGDAAILPPETLAHFQRPHEVVLT